MSGRMDWRRARRWQSHESKYGQGVVLANGHITPSLPKDELARRAERAMRVLGALTKPCPQSAAAKMKFVESQAVYAKYGIALFPMHLNEDGSKRPLVRNFERIGVLASAQLAKKFGDAAAFGFVCGKRSKITVLDVDDVDERVLADAMGDHGKTPLVVKTARQHFQAWYRWNGEQRRIRPNPCLPIDILGSGAVVAPNSSGIHGRYEVIQGSLEDIARLPALANIPPVASPDVSAMGADSGRNNWLFRQLGREAHHCDDFDALLDRARTLNDQFAVSLPDSEVVRTAKSVWKMTSEGRNRLGHYGAWSSVSEIDRLVADPYLYTLLSWLRAHNRPDRTFLVADGLKDKFDWPRRQLCKARQRAIDTGWLVQVSAPRRGCAAFYVWEPKAGEAGKKISNVYVEDSLPESVGHSVRVTLGPGISEERQ